MTTIATKKVVANRNTGVLKENKTEIVQPTKGQTLTESINSGNVSEFKLIMPDAKGDKRDGFSVLNEMAEAGWDTRYQDLTESLLEVKGAKYTKQQADSTLLTMYNTYKLAESQKKAGKHKELDKVANIVNNLNLNTVTQNLNESLRLKAKGNPSKNKLVESVISTTANLQNPAQAVVDFVGIFYPQSTIHYMTDTIVLPRKNDVVYRMTSRYGNTAAGVTQGQIVFQNPTNGFYSSIVQSVSTPTVNAQTSYTITGNAGVGTPGTFMITTVVGGATVVLNDMPNFDNDVPVSGSLYLSQGPAGAATGTVVYDVAGAPQITLEFATAPDFPGTIETTYNYNYQAEDFNTTQIRSLYLDVQAVNLDATANPIKLITSTEFEFQLNSLAGVSAINSNQQAATGLISLERDLRYINNLLLMAGTDASLNFDAASSIYYPVTGKYAAFETVLVNASQLIQTTMGRGRLTTMIVGAQAANMLTFCPGFKASNIKDPVGPYLWGTMWDGTVSIIFNPFMPANTYLLYFRGFGPGDAPVLMGEWIPFYSTPDIQLFDLNNYQTVASFYDQEINWLTTASGLVGGNGGYVYRGTVSSYS